MFIVRAVRSSWSVIRRHGRDFSSWLAFLISSVSIIFVAATLGREDSRALLSAIVVFLGLLALFLMARKPVVHYERAVESPAPVTTISPRLIVNEVRMAALISYGQIGTVQVRQERRKSQGDFKDVINPFIGEELVMDVGVRVVAGVNLKHLREEDVRIDKDGKGGEITLPPTKVMMVYVDESLTQIVSHKKGWLSRRDISLMDSARREAMESMVNAAIDKGLLEKAGEQAAATVAGIARGMGLEGIKVIPTLPPVGAHFEELQNADDVAKVRALPAARDSAPMLSDE